MTLEIKSTKYTANCLNLDKFEFLRVWYVDPALLCSVVKRSKMEYRNMFQAFFRFVYFKARTRGRDGSYQRSVLDNQSLQPRCLLSQSIDQNMFSLQAQPHDMCLLNWWSLQRLRDTLLCKKHVIKERAWSEVFDTVPHWWGTFQGGTEGISVSVWARVVSDYLNLPTLACLSLSCQSCILLHFILKLYTLIDF